MAKQKKNISFKDGLESLLMDAFNEAPNEDTLFGKTTPKPKTARSKNFAADLSSMFEEALLESVEEQVEEKKTSSEQAVSPETTSYTGLDNLIKNTVETSKVSITNKEKQKRVTFLFDKEKLNKLKTIARIEKTYLKNIVNEVVGEFISEYERDKGHLKLQ